MDSMSKRARDALLHGDADLIQKAQDLLNPDSLQARQRAARKLLGTGPIDETSAAFRAAQRRLLGIK